MTTDAQSEPYIQAYPCRSEGSTDVVQIRVGRYSKVFAYLDEEGARRLIAEIEAAISAAGAKR
jgi:hypothetical protein